MAPSHAFTLPAERAIVPAPPARRSPRPADEDLPALVEAACTGDDIAWAQLVERFSPLLRRIARRYDLRPADIDDVVQATWISLFQRIADVRDPGAIAGWLVTTVRRECLRALHIPVREQLTSDSDLGERAAGGGPEADLLEAEQREILVTALTTLPKRDRKLLGLLISDAAPTYREAAATLGVPVGTIGPSRARILARLQLHPALRGLRV